MNLSSHCKNIHIVNKDNEDEDQVEEDEDDEAYEDNDDDNEEEVQIDGDEEYNEEGEDDEPDFMDNSGKCWEFGCKIRDEKHLEERCRKMGRMIVGNEEKLTRQFHCHIKECQFKAIFLKAYSIVYKRNKHNHALKNEKTIQMKLKKEEKPSLTYEQDYIDHWGKLWSFHAHIGKNISQDKLLRKFGFSRIRKHQKTLNLHCRKSNSAGGTCPFVGIYLKSNGCLYTRGEHEHTKNGKIPQNVGDDYVDIFGKIWKFNKEIGKSVNREIFTNKFGFSCIQKKESGLYLICGKNGSNECCKFSGVYLKSNGCLYTRGKHNHEYIEKNPKPSVGDDYVDRLGKIWHFHAEVGTNVPKVIWQNKFGFTLIRHRKQTLNLYMICQKKSTNGGKCPIKGIYLHSNGYLYIRGKHDHK